MASGTEKNRKYARHISTGFVYFSCLTLVISSCPTVPQSRRGELGDITSLGSATMSNSEEFISIFVYPVGHISSRGTMTGNSGSSIVQNLRVVSREQVARTNGLSGCTATPYTSALWSLRTKMQPPARTSQARTVESQLPEISSQGISGFHASPRTLPVCPVSCFDPPYGLG